jgi:hypothetical protein
MMERGQAYMMERGWTYMMERGQAYMMERGWAYMMERGGSLLPFPKSSRMETGTWRGATIPFLSRDKGGLDYGVHLLPFLSTVGNK